MPRTVSSLSVVNKATQQTGVIWTKTQDRDEPRRAV